MSRIQKLKCCCFDCSSRTGTLIVLTIDLVLFEYLLYLKNDSNFKNVVLLIAGWSSLIAALCGAIKNQPLLLIPYVAVKLVFISCSILAWLRFLSMIAFDQSVTPVDLFLEIFLQLYLFGVEWSVTVVGLYGVMKEKPALQIPYVVVKLLDLVFSIIAFFVIPIIVLYNALGFWYIYFMVLIEIIVIILLGIFYVKFIIALSYYKECRLKYRVVDTELSTIN